MHLITCYITANNISSQKKVDLRPRKIKKVKTRFYKEKRTVEQLFLFAHCICVCGFSLICSNNEFSQQHFNINLTLQVSNWGPI